MRGATRGWIIWQVVRYFYSHTSCEVQPTSKEYQDQKTNFYSHTSCEVQHVSVVTYNPTDIISTHTPHARCNNTTEIQESIHIDFYSHTSCEVQQKKQQKMYKLQNFYSHTSCEVQHNWFHWITFNFQFLLTHLMRGATYKLFLRMVVNSNFYSHTSCEVQHHYYPELFGCKDFYSHTSCEVQRFYRIACKNIIVISTHTPHARCN